MVLPGNIVILLIPYMVVLKITITAVMPPVGEGAVSRTHPWALFAQTSLQVKTIGNSAQDILARWLLTAAGLR